MNKQQRKNKKWNARKQIIDKLEEKYIMQWLIKKSD